MLIWIAAALCAFYIKGLCGFANTLVFTSILSFTSSNISISPVELVLGYPTNAILAYRERTSIDWKLCLPMTALVLAGSVPGMLLLKNADTDMIKALFGLVTMLLGVEMLLRGGQKKSGRESKLLLGVVGLLSGLLCGLYGVGALLGAYMSRVTTDTRAFKANLCVVFLAENTLRIVVYTALGILTADVLLRALCLTPIMLLALFMGMLSARRVDERIIRMLVIVLLIISGAALVLKAL